MDIVLFSAPPNGCRDTQYPTWRMIERKGFHWGSGGWEAEACTPLGVVLIFLGVVFNVSPHLYDSCCGSATTAEI